MCVYSINRGGIPDFGLIYQALKTSIFIELVLDLIPPLALRAIPPRVFLIGVRASDGEIPPTSASGTEFCIDTKGRQRQINRAPTINATLCGVVQIQA